MKKIGFAVVIAVMLGLLAGCSPKKTVQTVQQMDVVIHIQSDEVYSIGMEYWVDRVLLGGQVCMGDPNAIHPIKKGDKVHFTFTEFDFESVPNFGSGTFGFAAEIALAQEEYVPEGFVWEWNAQYGREYHFVLTDSLALEPMTDDITYTKMPLNEISLK